MSETQRGMNTMQREESSDQPVRIRPDEKPEAPWKDRMRGSKKKLSSRRKKQSKRSRRL